jgi:hypothetical protein
MGSAQFLQFELPSGLSVPQVGQRIKGSPQTAQNFDPGGEDIEHLSHSMALAG